MTAPYNVDQASYNKFETYPLTPYNIVKYLMDNDDQIWKVLNYSDADAWNKPNLTLSQKAGLVYNGLSNETDFRVFLDTGQDNAWTVEACILRISTGMLSPTNYVYGHLSMSCEVYSHYKINHMSNYITRLDFITQRLLEVLNGAEIDGVGKLYFDAKASSQAKSFPIGAIPYKGRVTIFCNHNLG